MIYTNGNIFSNKIYTTGKLSIKQPSQAIWTLTEIRKIFNSIQQKPRIHRLLQEPNIKLPSNMNSIRPCNSSVLAAVTRWLFLKSNLQRLVYKKSSVSKLARSTHLRCLKPWSRANSNWSSHHLPTKRQLLAVLTNHLLALVSWLQLLWKNQFLLRRKRALQCCPREIARPRLSKELPEFQH